MSIASELQNYADGLDDAWDAAEDMGATIPHDRNMNNLDTAIRTIPVSSPNDGVLTIQQNGTTLGTFTADQATNTTVNVTAPTTTVFYWKSNSSSVRTLYKDYAATQAATGQDIYDAFSSGILYIEDGDSPLGDNTVYTAVSWDDDENRLSATTTTATAGVVNWKSANVSFDWDSTTQLWTRTVTKLSYSAGTNVTISADNEISATDTTYSDFTGATSSTAGSNGLVPAPSAGDQEKVLHGDGTWKDTTAKLVEMSYGESNAWAKFIAAYNAGSIVYCRASSNSNPGTGSQTRKAFMAYVNNATSPTSVEFQYVRSVSSKTDSQQCDQVFVYTLTNASGGTWSVASRNMAPKINVSGPITKTFSNGANATVTIGANAMTGATSGAAGAAGVVPKPNSGDQNKVLTGGGSWVDLAGDYSTTEVATPYTWVDGKTIYKRTFKTDNVTQAQTVVTHGISNFGALVNAEGVMYTSGQGYQPLDRVLPAMMDTWGWGLGDVRDTTFTLFFGSGYTLSQITTWITLYYTKSS